jgi:uncharacterized surface protein with fasciclin (FAS1) repeats
MTEIINYRGGFTMDSGNKTAMLAVALIIGLVVGGFGGWMIGDMKKDNAMTASANTSSMAEQKSGVLVGGALMVRDKDIVDNAVNAPNVSTVVSLVKKADLVETLKSEGPFTVFAPNNDAFGKLDKATVASLQMPENKAALANILTYHVVPGTYTTAALKVMAQKGESLTTVQGQMLMPVLEDGKLMIQDASGGKVSVETSDVISSNGVTHVIASVLMPKS